MVNVYCDNEACDGEHMHLVEEDARCDRYSAVYQCHRCERKKIHRREFEQSGMVLLDVVEDE